MNKNQSIYTYNTNFTKSIYLDSYYNYIFRHIISTKHILFHIIEILTQAILLSASSFFFFYININNVLIIEFYLFLSILC